MKAYFLYPGKTVTRDINLPMIGVGKGIEAMQAREALLKQALRDHVYNLSVAFRARPEKVYLIAQSKMNEA